MDFEAAAGSIITIKIIKLNTGAIGLTHLRQKHNIINTIIKL